MHSEQSLHIAHPSKTKYKSGHQDKLVIPVGQYSFAEIIHKMLYVDKSLLIKEIIEDESTLVKIFTRPKRFGKSLNISMLQHFFAKEVDGKSTDSLFDTLKIAKEEECMFHQGKYPVIFLDLKDLEAKNYPLFYELICQKMTDIYKEHDYLENSKYLDEDEKKFIKIILNKAKQTISEVDFRNSLKKLTLFLRKHREGLIQEKPGWKKEDLAFAKTVILIDEYDTPMISANIHGYWEDMVDLLKNFLKNALKGNDTNLFRVIMTGIVKVVNEQIFSDMNNYTLYSTTMNAYSEYFGFTSSEVRWLLHRFSLEHLFDEIEQWYGCYYFGNNNIFNPWSVVKFLNEYVKDPQFKEHWLKVSSGSLIKNKLDAAGEEVHQKIKDLLENKSVIVPIKEEISFRELSDHDKNSKMIWLWNYLLLNGYLTRVPLLEGGREKNTHQRNQKLIIPNLELREFYFEIARSWFPNLELQEFRARKELIMDSFNAQESKHELEEFYKNIKQQKNIDINILYVCAIFNYDFIPISFLEKYSAESSMAILINYLSNYLLCNIMTNGDIKFISINKQFLSIILADLQEKNEKNYLSLLTKLLDFILEEFNCDEHSLDKIYYARSFFPCIANYSTAVRKANNEKVRFNSSKIAELFLRIGKYYLYINIQCSEAINYFKRSKKLCSNDKNHRGKIYSLMGKAYYKECNYVEAKKYLDKAKGILEKTKKSDIHEVARCYVRRAKLKVELGDHEGAQEDFLKGLEYYRGENSIEQWNIEVNIAFTDFFTGKNEGAREKCIKALGLVSQNTKDKHSYIPRILLKLAQIEIALGAHEDASQRLTKVESLLVNYYGENHPDIARLYNIWGELYIGQGKPTEAKKLHCRALDILKKHFQEQHLSIANTYTLLAVATDEMSNPRDAISYSLEALKIFKELYKTMVGEKHPRIAQQNNILGEANRAIGDLQLAASYYEESKKIHTRIYSAKHPNVGIEWNNLGEVQLELGYASKAIENFDKALEIMLAFYKDSHHILVLTIKHNVAKAKAFKGEYAEALDDCRNILSLLKGQSNLLEHAKLHITVGSLYCKLGNAAAGIKQLKKACSLLQNEDKNHIELVKTYYEMGISECLLGRLNKAKKHFDNALKILTAKYGNIHPEIAKIYSGLAFFHYIDLNFVEAEACYKKAEKVFSNYQLQYWFGEIYFGLAKIYYMQGKYDHALEKQKQALPIFKKFYGDKHPKLAELYFDLYKIHYKLKPSSTEKNTEKNAAKNEYEKYHKLFLSVNKYQYSSEVFDLKKQMDALVQLCKMDPKLSTTMQNKISLILNKLDQTHFENQKKSTIDLIYLDSKDYIIANKEGLLEDLLQIYNEDKARYGENSIYTVNNLKLLAITHFIIDDKESAKNYLTQSIEMDQGTNLETSMLLSTLPLAFFVLTDLAKIIDQYEAWIDNIAPDWKLYHNLGCFYHLQARNEKLHGDEEEHGVYLKKAAENFLTAIKMEKSSASYVEYANLLIYRDERNKAIDNLKVAIENNKQERLIYTAVAKVVLTEPLRKELEFRGSFTIDVGTIAYHLWISCYIALKTESAKLTALAQKFAEYVNSMLNPTALDYYILAEAYKELDDKEQAKLYLSKSISVYKPIKNKLTYEVAEALNNVLLADNSSATYVPYYPLKRVVSDVFTELDSRENLPLNKNLITLQRSVSSNMESLAKNQSIFYERIKVHLCFLLGSHYLLIKNYSKCTNEIKLKFVYNHCDSGFFILFHLLLEIKNCLLLILRDAISIQITVNKDEILITVSNTEKADFVITLLKKSGLLSSDSEELKIDTNLEPSCNSPKKINKASPILSQFQSASSLSISSSSSHSSNSMTASREIHSGSGKFEINSNEQNEQLLTDSDADDLHSGMEIEQKSIKENKKVEVKSGNTNNDDSIFNLAPNKYAIWNKRNSFSKPVILVHNPEADIAVTNPTSITEEAELAMTLNISQLTYEKEQVDRMQAQIQQNFRELIDQSTRASSEPSFTTDSELEELHETEEEDESSEDEDLISSDSLAYSGT